MFTLTPGMLRALSPACPPGMWLRLATFVVVATVTLTLLHSGLSLPAALVTLAVIAAVAILMTMTSAGRVVAGLARTLASELNNTAPAGAGAR
jgi:hypothetical protein